MWENTTERSYFGDFSCFILVAANQYFANIFVCLAGTPLGVLGGATAPPKRNFAPPPRILLEGAKNFFNQKLSKFTRKIEKCESKCIKSDEKSIIWGVIFLKTGKSFFAPTARKKFSKTLGAADPSKQNLKQRACCLVLGTGFQKACRVFWDKTRHGFDRVLMPWQALGSQTGFRRPVVFFYY